MNGDKRIDETLSVWIGKEIQLLREQRGLTCAEVAETTGVELVMVEQIERGDGGSVSLDTLRKLAGALDRPLHALFEGIEDDRIAGGPFGLRLTQLRKRRGWSRAQLAESSGLTVATIEQMEREQFSPGLVELQQLASALGLLLSELFEDGPGRVTKMADPAAKPLGVYVKRLRGTHGLTQQVLADRCGLSPDTIRCLELGAFSPSLDTIRKLSTGLDLSVAQLFAGFEVDGHDEETGDLVALVRGCGPRTIARIVDLVRIFLRALDERSPAQPRSGP